MSINSRNKGATGERELANVLKFNGYKARRGQQFCGYNGDADVIGLNGYHIECKRVEKLNIDKAYEQSCRDSKDSDVPIVCHRKNHKKWLVTLSLNDFLSLVKK